MHNQTQQSPVPLQPFPLEMAGALPVNYYLFVRTISDKAISAPTTVHSHLHNTSAYVILPFYKAISNIL
ncbi:hypothetical protein [Chitinophaga rhizophila]|uniref:Uncharacterized protein n=1 Tax=Chitinophaga rhizophila TaxID=2866212 RepID=A0ABS7GJU1_9BACT|nr:hypothetical protein [Chitinophaga rhizophila]MBW8687986.1 hypothetical protein [Chitinophaga rhizophila]